MNKAEQVNVTGNHSTMQISHEHIFLFDNTYMSASLLNDTDVELTLIPGSLITRKSDDATKVVPATEETLANVIGIVSTDGNIVLAGAEETEITYALKGTVNKDLLSFPTGVTLETMVNGKTLQDVLQGIGFQLEGAVEHTKFDN